MFKRAVRRFQRRIRQTIRENAEVMLAMKDGLSQQCLIHSQRDCFSATLVADKKVVWRHGAARIMFHAYILIKTFRTKIVGGIRKIIPEFKLQEMNFSLPAMI